MTATSAVVRIPKDIDERLARLAEQTGRSKAYYARRALHQFLEDREDYLLAVAAYEEGGERISLEEVRTRLGLDD